jgi:biopolymer transport protein ExbD
VYFRRPSKLKVAIEIAPLVDIVFLLVIFFAVSTTFLETSGMKLDLPASTSTASRETQEITVNLAADGRLEFQGEAVTREELSGLLSRSMDDRELRKVVLRADTRTPHGEVVRIMDLIREAGAETLTVAARSPEE